MGAGGCCSLAWMSEKVRENIHFSVLWLDNKIGEIYARMDRSDYISSYSARADPNPVKTNF
jgi:hypothetical protein